MLFDVEGGIVMILSGVDRAGGKGHDRAEQAKGDDDKQEIMIHGAAGQHRVLRRMLGGLFVNGLGIDGINGLNGGVQAVAQDVQTLLHVLAEAFRALLVEGIAGGLLLGLAEDLAGRIRHLAGELPPHGDSPHFHRESVGVIRPQRMPGCRRRRTPR